MMVHDILLGAVLVVNVVGVIFFKRWIDSLKGTVEAQKTALDAVHRVLDTVMNVFKATDPDRWAKEVAVHKELADKKVAAILEEEARKMEVERRKGAETTIAIGKSAVQVLGQIDALRLDAMRAATRLLAEIPKESREQIILDMGLTPLIQHSLLKAAAELPEAAPQLRINEVSIAFQKLRDAARLDHGGMAVRLPLREK